MKQPKVGERVEFRDTHAQRILGLTLHLDDTILWLNKQEDSDPEWVLLSDVLYVPESGRWIYMGD